MKKNTLYDICQIMRECEKRYKTDDERTAKHVKLLISCFGMSSSVCHDDKCMYWIYELNGLIGEQLLQSREESRGVQVRGGERGSPLASLL